MGKTKIRTLKRRHLFLTDEQVGYLDWMGKLMGTESRSQVMRNLIAEGVESRMLTGARKPRRSSVR